MTNTFTMKNPNIVYIHSHDTGRYIQPYGFAVKTPNLQRFAEEGVLFRQAFCAAPTCSPSRAALLTGRYAHQAGMTALAHKGGQLTDPGMHLANFLKKNGYSTALSGTQHVVGGTDLESRHAVGYERLLTMETWPSWAKDFESWNEWYAEAAAEYLLHQDGSQPFYLDCGFDITHRVGEGEQWHTTRDAPAGDPRYVRPPAPLPDTPEVRRDFADYSVAVTQLDACIGRVLAALETAGLAENTIVFITTDHGIAFPFMKCNLTAHGTGVMLLMRGPGGFRGGKVLDAYASHVDVFPTLCELSGLAAPDGLEGVSLVPLVNDGTPVRDAVYSEVNWHAAPEPMRSVRTARYNYIRRFAPHSGPVLPNCDDSVTKTYLLKAGWKERPQPEEELYDLIFDPNEVCNRSYDPGLSGVLAEHRALLRAWMEKTANPILTGMLVPWPDAASQTMDDSSPQGNWGKAMPVLCLPIP